MPTGSRCPPHGFDPGGQKSAKLPPSCRTEKNKNSLHAKATLRALEVAIGRNSDRRREGGRQLSIGAGVGGRASTTIIGLHQKPTRQRFRRP